MPELPEVEAVRLRVDHASRGQRITAVTLHPDKIIFDQDSAKAIKNALVGSKITGTDRRGKYFWLKTDHVLKPVFHLGMTGYFVIKKLNLKEDTPMRGKPKLSIKLTNGTDILFFDPRRFGRMRLSKDPLHEPPISLLGYDPLFNFPTAKVLHSLLIKRKAPLKAILLDQSLFAGVGNWIADEVLYQSKLSPHRLGASLKMSEVSTLRKWILSTIKKAVSVSADKEKLPSSWLFHVRWGKKKEALSPLGEKMIHETVGGRTTAWVPTRQL